MLSLGGLGYLLSLVPIQVYFGGLMPTPHQITIKGHRRTVLFHRFSFYTRDGCLSAAILGNKSCSERELFG